MSNYYITGIWKTNGVITHVMLHGVDANNNLLTGSKTTEATAIQHIGNGHILKTLKWDYSISWWRTGAIVTVVQEAGRRYLRTQRDATVTDNLDNLIALNQLIHNS